MNRIHSDISASPRRFAAVLKRRVVVAALVVCVGGSLIWATASPAGSFQPPLQVAHVNKVVRVSADEGTVRGVARCRDGWVATGGGVRTATDEPVMVEFDSVTRDGAGWEARGGAIDDEDSETYKFTVTAVCAKGSAAAVLAVR